MKQNKSEKQMWCYNMYWFADKITIDKINTYYNKVYERFKDKLVDYYGTITHAERIKKLYTKSQVDEMLAKECNNLYGELIRENIRLKAKLEEIRRAYKFKWVGKE